MVGPDAQPLADKQYAGRVKNSPTVWERRAAEDELRKFKESPAGKAIAKLEAKVKALEDTLRNLRGEGGITVAMPVIALDPVKKGGGADDTETENFYCTRAGILYTRDFNGSNMVEVV